MIRPDDYGDRAGGSYKINHKTDFERYEKHSDSESVTGPHVFSGVTETFSGIVWSFWKLETGDPPGQISRYSRILMNNIGLSYDSQKSTCGEAIGVPLVWL